MAKVRLRKAKKKAKPKAQGRTLGEVTGERAWPQHVQPFIGGRHGFLRGGVLT